MNDEPNDAPAVLAALVRSAEEIGFKMSCETKTGALLRTLAASRPAAQILELGTGVGVSTAWILDGMDEQATLLTADTDERAVAIARQCLGHDRRVKFRVEDGEELIGGLQGQQFDIIFADTWPGKFYALDPCLALLARGGLYVIDDLLPQPTWPEGHGPKVNALVETLERRADLRLVKMAWASGLILATRS